jgi:electron-transferring-flavoprotein dehydrogenase
LSPERDRLEADVLVVGGGPAGLACAYRLARLARAAGAPREIVVVEKAQEAGQHILSGAVMDPHALDALFEGRWREMGFPLEAPVESEAVYYLTARRKFRFPFVPPTLRNEGSYLVALSRVVQWMRDQAAAEGVNVFEGFPADRLLFEGERVVGAVTADRGIDRAGRPKPSFTPGTEIRARVTVLAEGTRGSLTKELVERLKLSGPNPQSYGLGLKEIWEVPAGRLRPGQVIHTAGWPLRHSHYGGGWIYGLAGGRVSIGFVPALDYREASFDPHESMQRWKSHPLLRGILSGGKLLQAGAKTVPEGGFWSQPRLWGDGFLIAGDAGSFLNAPRLKGIHTAMESGRLAAEAIEAALRSGSTGAAALSAYGDLYRRSWLHRELWAVRNVRQAFNRGFFPGTLRAGLMLLTGGRILADRIPLRPDHSHLEKRAGPGGGQANGEPLLYDGTYTIDRLTAVYLAGAMHEEDQPSHLVVADTDICRTRCAAEYWNPCQHFCPARVYEMVDDPASGPDGRRLQINHSNCVHCKTCDIMDPYEIITWKVPSDAGGPRYLGL